MSFSSINNIKILGLPIGRGSGKMPKDGDGDGMYTAPGSDEDNVPLAAAREIARRVFKRDKRNYVPPTDEEIGKMLAALREPNSGFTKEKTEGRDVTTGISIARNRHGVKMQSADMFDENGKATPEAIRLFKSFLVFHGREVFFNPQDGAREVGIGGWHNEEDGIIYLDIVDIHDNPHGVVLPQAFRQRMYDLGKRNNQISIANLDAIDAQDWDNGFIQTDGSGNETLDLEAITRFGRDFPNPKKKSKKSLLTELLDTDIMVVKIERGI